MFEYNGVSYRVQPGQKFSLPGSRAYLYVKHLTSLIYRRVEGRDDMDKRTYPVNDKWAKLMIVQVNKTLSASLEDRNVVHDMPDYQAQDKAVEEETGLPGRLAGATSQGGGGEFETKPVDAREPDATDDDLDKIPDFDPNTAPKFRDESGAEVPSVPQPEPAQQSDEQPEADAAPAQPQEFPDAKKNQSKPARQPKK